MTTRSASSGVEARIKAPTPVTYPPATHSPPSPAALSGTRLRSLIDAELQSLIALRRDLHQHPELSFQEKRTGQVVQRELAALNIHMKTGLGGGTGVIAYLPASTPEGNARPAIALRADMDALPIVEQTGLSYASCIPGVMHACGHDGHTAMLVGAARVLSKVDRPHPILLVFQPAEENEGGGKIMCHEGALKGERAGGLGNPVGRIYGLHGWPQLPLGHIATRPGPLMAAVDDFTVTIRGVQSHGAYPHLSRDPIVAAAHVLTALQTIASRNVGPLDAVVVSVGKIEGGTANNIIPETVSFIGTVRTLRDDIQALARARFLEIVESTARAHGCRAEIDYHPGYPVVVNDPTEARRVLDLARDVVGPHHAQALDHPTMGGEDFAFYGRHAPACFFFMGLHPSDAGDDYPSLHQPGFNFNDDAIPTGIEMFVRLATAD